MAGGFRYTRGMESWGRLLITLGLVLVAMGVLVSFSPSIPLGKLPGDIRIERPGFRLYVPITTSVVLSVVLSLVLWLFSRFR